MYIHTHIYIYTYVHLYLSASLKIQQPLPFATNKLVIVCGNTPIEIQILGTPSNKSEGSQQLRLRLGFKVWAMALSQQCFQMAFIHEHD